MDNHTTPGTNVGSAENKPDTSAFGGPYFEVIIGAVIAAVVVVLLLFLGVILRYMYQHKGTYRTNEAKGTEFAETADAALREDPTLQGAMDDSRKEYFI